MIDILLASCNGEAYIDEQIRSILDQTVKGWKLLVQDDASQDGTWGKLLDWTKRDSRISAYQNEKRAGVKKNFSTLMERSKGRIIFFADQDDIWHPNKLEAMIPFFSKEPLLVHSDLRGIGAKTFPSFWRYTGLYPEKAVTLPRILMQNPVTGCAMAINRSLLELAAPIPEEAVMHDWWLALAAAAKGKVIPLPEPLVDYRQHGGNVLGARAYSLFNIRKGDVDFEAQAKALLQRFPDLDLVKDYLSLSQASYFEKRRLILKNGFYKQGFLRNVKLFL